VLELSGLLLLLHMCSGNGEFLRAKADTAFSAF